VAPRVGATDWRREYLHEPVDGTPPGQLDAGGSASDDDEREPRGPAVGVRLDLARLERCQDPATDLEGALERLDVGRERPPLVVAEIGVARPGGDDQAVVRDRAPLVAAREPVEKDAPACEIEAGDLAEQDADVPVTLKNAAQRRRDLAGRERAGRHLVDERLKKVEVAPVDQGDVDGRVAQLSDGLQPAESAADDDDAVARA